MQTICKVYTWYALIMQWQIWGYAKTHFTFEQKLFFWASTSVVACYDNSNLVWWQKKSCKEDEGSREGGNELLQYAVRDKNWKTNWFHFNCLLRYKAGTWTQGTCTNKSALINGKKHSKVVWYHLRFKSKLKYSKRQTVRKNTLKAPLEMLGFSYKKKKNYTCQITIHGHPAIVQMSNKQDKNSAPRSKQQDFQNLAVHQCTTMQEYTMYDW